MTVQLNKRRTYHRSLQEKRKAPGLGNSGRKILVILHPAGRITPRLGGFFLLCIGSQSEPRVLLGDCKAQSHLLASGSESSAASNRDAFRPRWPPANPAGFLRPV